MKIPKQTLIKMISKLSFWFFILSLSNSIFANNAYSQTIDETKVSISVNNLSVVQIFKIIEKQTSFSFVYDSKVTGMNERFSFNENSITLRKFLKKLSAKAHLKFKQINRSISVNTSSAKTNQKNPQSIIITGTVTDEKGEPLMGATILVKGTNIGTTTDFDGNFSLEIPEDAKILEVSFIGYKTKYITIGNQTKFDIVLKEDAAKLDEVVIVGYGTRKKAILTSSVSQVKGGDLKKEPVTNITQALQGKASGVHVIASDAPGQSSTVIIRGLGTIQGGREPLYVVDGILTNNIDNINSSDIKSMNILKDAASLAIYGNRGANGVIVITTKNGKKGKMRINFDSYFGVRSILSRVKMANSEQFVVYSNEAIHRDLLNDNDPTNDNDTSGYFPSNQKYSTNWLDEITRQGFIDNYNLSISGGSDKIQAFFSAGFSEEEGILKNNDYDRLTLRSNINYRISSKLKFNQNISFQLANATPGNYSLFTAAYKQAPIVPVKDENGRYGSSADFNNVVNPVVPPLFNDNQNKFNKLQGSFKLDYKIIDPLNFTSRFSVERGGGKFYSFQDRLGLYLASNPDNREENFEGGVENPAKTRATITKTNDYRWFLDNYFTFHKTFKKDHTFKVTLGVTAEESNGEFLVGTRNNTPLDPDLRFNLNLGDEDDTQLSGGSFGVTNRLISFISRINYDYKNKYILNASFRRDGSSKFQKGHRYGNFYAVSAGWVLTEEDFMKNSFFDILKLRASYGQLGNQNVAFNVLTATTGSGGFYPFGPNQDLQQGITITGTVQKNLSWEVTNEINFGMEYTLLNRRLKGEIDLYQRVNSNATLQLQLPDIFGFAPFNSHVGEITNKGIEVSFNWSDAVNDKFKYNLGANFTYNDNKLTKITSRYFKEQIGGSLNNGQYTKRVAINQPLGSFYLYEVAGVDENGELIYSDLNKNGIIDEGDRKYFGSYIPKYFFSFFAGVNYKNFDFEVDTFGNIGNKVYNGKKAQRFGNENIELSTFNSRWTTASPNTTSPRASNDVPLASNYYLESGTFFRINKITLGYTLPKMKYNVFSKIRLYVSAKNPFIYKEFSGFTPELSGNGGGNPLGTAGIELDAYPSLKSFYFGLNASL